MMNMDKISIIVPCYNEEQALPLFYAEVTKVAAQIEAGFEFLFIDDGSRDGTLNVLRSLAERDARVRYVSFSRNFGKESALYAGLQNATGDYAAVMDADLQDPPALLPQMYADVKSGQYDCVGTRRVTRKGEPPIRSFFARTFYKMINKMSDVQLVDGARDYRLMTRQMVDAILSMPEYNRFSKGLFSWVGFRTKWIEYENVERVAGETKWSFWKLFKYSIDGIIGFTTAPLSFASVVGVLMLLVALILIIWIIVKTLVAGGDPVAGWPSLACLVLFVGGLTLFCTGISGQYIARMYMEVKGRPLYITKETEQSKKGE